VAREPFVRIELVEVSARFQFIGQLDALRERRRLIVYAVEETNGG
jgi:hypothetical protein